MNCRLCNGDRLRLYYTQGNADQFRFYRCDHCALVNYDLEGGTDQHKYSDFQDPLDDRSRSNRTQAASYSFIREFRSPPGEFVEIGCGNGHLLNLASKDGWQVRGLELSPELARGVEQTLGIPVEVADFMQAEIVSRGPYDVVVMRHVLEHLPDSLLALSRIRDLLKPGGLAFLEFPNIEALDLRVKRWLRRHGSAPRHYRADYRPGHCNEFCRGSFEFLCTRVGVDLVKWETYSHRPLADLFYRRIHVGNKARAIIRRPAKPAEEVAS